jgi:altronate hydrolase
MLSEERALLHLGSTDTVAVALRDLGRGERLTVAGRSAPLLLAQDVPQAHKVAVAAMRAGDPVVKYGQVIGIATAAIAAGEHVHVHNVQSARVTGGAT